MSIFPRVKTPGNKIGHAYGIYINICSERCNPVRTGDRYCNTGIHSAVEAQATDRAFRIGQKHNVTVHRIITKNTLEENIDRLMDQKRDLANLTVTTGEKWIGDLTDREIEGLVGLKREKG